MVIITIYRVAVIFILNPLKDLFIFTIGEDKILIIFNISC